MTDQSDNQKRKEHEKKVRRIIISIVVFFVFIAVVNVFTTGKFDAVEAFSSFFWLVIFIPFAFSKGRKGSREGMEKDSISTIWDMVAQTNKPKHINKAMHEPRDREMRRTKNNVDENMVRNIIAVVVVLTLVVIGLVLTFLL